MNKLAIPAILAATVLVAGIFVFAPIEQASTVHTSGTITIENDADIDAILDDTGTTIPATLTTITDAISIEDIFADIDTATSANDDAIIVDFLIIEQSGDAVTGLIAVNFGTDFIAGTTPGAVTILVTDSGSGGYRITIDPTNNWDAGRTSIVLTATSGVISTSTLLVVDIT